MMEENNSFHSRGNTLSVVWPMSFVASSSVLSCLGVFLSLSFIDSSIVAVPLSVEKQETVSNQTIDVRKIYR